MMIKSHNQILQAFLIPQLLHEKPIVEWNTLTNSQNSFANPSPACKTWRLPCRPSKVVNVYSRHNSSKDYIDSNVKCIIYNDYNNSQLIWGSPVTGE